MPGIAGIVDFQKQDLTGQLTKMLTCLKSESWHKTDYFNQAGVGLGRVSLRGLEPQPVFTADRSLGLILNGEVYQYPEDFSDFIKKNWPGKLRSDAELVLQLIQHRGIEAVSGLNGAFVLALWNSKEKTLTIANDRYGLKPLYYSSFNHLFAFSSEVKSILTIPKVSRDVEPQAVAEFLTFEYFLGNRAFFKSIMALEPASILIFKSGNLSMRNYWKAGFSKEETFFWKEKPLDNAKDLLCQAVKRQVTGEKRVALALSGGLDSRLILAAAAEAGCPIPTYTFGIKDCDDARIARLVADCLGSENHFFELSPRYLSIWAGKGVWRTDGMNNCTNFAGIELYSEVGEKWRIILNGSGGNELWGGISPGLLKFLFIQDEKKLAHAFFRKMSTGFPENTHNNLFQSGYYTQIRGAVYQRFEESLNRSPDQSSLGKIYHFYRQEKTRRGTLMGLVLDSDQIEYRLPFFDYDLFDFIQTIPHKLRVLAGFKRRLVTEKFPRMASIPYQRTGLPVDASLFSILFRRFGNRFGSLFQKGASPANRVCFDNAGWLRNELRDFVVSTLLNPKALDRGYFKPGYVVPHLRFGQV